MKATCRGRLRGFRAIRRRAGVYRDTRRAHITDMTERTLDRRREALLDATLTHVPFDGWSMQALAAGAKDAGLDREFVHRAFPRGAIDAVAFWSELADRRMAAALDPAELAAMRVRDRIVTGVRTRLELLQGDHEAMRRAATLLALPPNAPVAARCVWRTVDAIWRCAGDDATDFNYYTKRSILAGVYLATVTYWLSDRSEGNVKTWDFLARRIDDALRLPKAIEPLTRPFRWMPDPAEFLKSLRRPHMPRGRRW
jgi:ubiquinone biosynthesis protein COQ9